MLLEALDPPQQLQPNPAASNENVPNSENEDEGEDVTGEAEKATHVRGGTDGNIADSENETKAVCKTWKLHSRLHQMVHDGSQNYSSVRKGSKRRCVTFSSNPTDSQQPPQHTDAQQL